MSLKKNLSLNEKACRNIHRKTYMYKAKGINKHSSELENVLNVLTEPNKDKLHKEKC